MTPRTLFTLAGSDSTATRLYDIARGDRESLTVVTTAGERFRAFRDGRGVTVQWRRTTVFLESPSAAAAYCKRLLAFAPPADRDARATLVALVEGVVSL